MGHGNIYDFEVTYDVDGIRKLAKRLDDMADRLDALDQSMPEQVDAGVYAPLIAEHVNETVANLAALILRLRDAATLMRKTADEKENAEDDNVKSAREIPTHHGRIRPE